MTSLLAELKAKLKSRSPIPVYVHVFEWERPVPIDYRRDPLYIPFFYPQYIHGVRRYEAKYWDITYGDMNEADHMEHDMCTICYSPKLDKEPTSSVLQSEIESVCPPYRRMCMEDFWFGLSGEERGSLIAIARDSMDKALKDPRMHHCSYVVRSREQDALEKEIHSLYDAYRDELINDVEHQKRWPSSLSFHHFPGEASLDQSGHVHTIHFEGRSITRRCLKDESGLILEDPDNDSEENGVRVPHGSLAALRANSSRMKQRTTAPNPRKAGSSKGPSKPRRHLTETEIGKIIIAADELFKKDGRKFSEMFRQLAEYRMQSVGKVDDTEDDSEKGNKEERVKFDECDEKTMTLEQKIEKTKFMFFMFAARFLEQHIYQAYREQVAQEHQLQLLRELEDEDNLSKERESKKEIKKKREKREKERKRQQKEAKDEERARRDAEKVVEEHKKQEERRLLHEAKHKAQEEEKRRKIMEHEENLRKSKEREKAKRKEKEEKKRKEEKDRLAVQQSFAALNNQNASIRRKGVEALKKLVQHQPAGLDSAVNRHTLMLLALLKDSNKTVRLASVKLLCDLAEHVEIGADAEKAIVGLLDAGDNHLRSSGAYLIAKLVNHVEPDTTVVDSIPNLLRMLGDNDVIVRHAGISAIAKLAEHGEILPSITCATPELFALLKEGDHRIRHAGTAVLTKIAEHARLHLVILDAIPEICELLGDVRWWTRNAAAGVLGRLFKDADLHPDIRYRVLHQLFPLLKDRETSARFAAVDAFCRWTEDLDVRSVDRWIFIAELLEMLQDSSRSIRFTAVEVIITLAKQSSMLHFKFAIALHQLPAMLKHSVWGVRRTAICLIEKLVDISTLRPAIVAVSPWLLRLLKACRTKQSDPPPSSSEPRIVSVLSPSPTGCTIDEYAPTCCAALEVVLKLAQYDDMHPIIRAHVPLLLSLLESSDLAVQGACRNAILNLFKYGSLRPALASAMVRPLFIHSVRSNDGREEVINQGTTAISFAPKPYFRSRVCGEHLPTISSRSVSSRVVFIYVFCR